MPGAKSKVLVILGPTASGKSDLAVDLARKWNGEVISADSRQVYRGLNIGTGKVPLKRSRLEDRGPKQKHLTSNAELLTYGGIRHHLLDVVSPRRIFSVAGYQKLGRRAIEDALRRGKLPIICGGTGLYIDALLYNYSLPSIPPDKKLRVKLEKQTAEKLFKRLQALDLRRAETIDRWNKRRLVRALEIVLKTGKPVPSLIRANGSYDIFKIGIFPGQEKLKERVHKRLLKRLRRGMIREAELLHRRGLSWRRMEELGLEYRYLARLLQGKITKKEMTEQLEKEILRYAKRQMTWFKRDKEIHWIPKLGGARDLTLDFLGVRK